MSPTRPHLLIRLLAAAAIAVSVLAAPALATTMVKLELPDLATRAPLIVVGTATAQQSEWFEKRIITRTTFTIEKAIKGEASGSITIVTLGGVVDGIGQRVAGTARFAPDETAVVFLEPSPIDGWRVVGMAQGKLRIEPGVDGGRVVRDLSGATLMQLGADGGPPREVTGDSEIALDAFVARLAALLAAPATADDGAAEPNGTTKPADLRPTPSTVAP